MSSKFSHRSTRVQHTPSICISKKKVYPDPTPPPPQQGEVTLTIDWNFPLSNPPITTKQILTQIVHPPEYKATWPTSPPGLHTGQITLDNLGEGGNPNLNASGEDADNNTWTFSQNWDIGAAPPWPFESATKTIVEMLGNNAGTATYKLNEPFPP